MEPNTGTVLLNDDSKRGKVRRNSKLNTQDQGLEGLELGFEQKSFPELIEDVLILLAPYVLRSDGINGLCRFRLVSKLWNSVGTKLLSKQNCPNRDQWVDLKQFLNFVQSRSEDGVCKVAFKRFNCLVSRREDEMPLLLGPNYPWTAALTWLTVSTSDIFGWNDMMKNIITSFQHLKNLELFICEIQEIYRRKSNVNCCTNSRIHSRCLKRVSLKFEGINDSQFQHFEHFDWNFIQACPNLEALNLDLRNDYTFRLIALELVRLPPKLKILELTDYEYSSCFGLSSWSFDIHDLIPCVNHFQLTTLKYWVPHNALPEIIQQTSDSCGTIENLHLTLTGPASNESVLQFLCSTVLHPRFKNLKVLILHLDFIISNEPLTALNIPVMETIREFEILANEERTDIPYLYGSLSQCFPNLEIFYGEVWCSNEALLLSTQLVSLKKIWRLTLELRACDLYLPERSLRMRNRHFEISTSLSKYSAAFQAIRGVPMLSDFGLLTWPGLGDMSKESVDLIARDMKKLRRLHWNAEPCSLKQLGKYVTKKLVQERKVVVKFLEYHEPMW